MCQERPFKIALCCFFSGQHTASGATALDPVAAAIDGEWSELELSLVRLFQALGVAAPKESLIVNVLNNYADAPGDVEGVLDRVFSAIFDSVDVNASGDVDAREMLLADAAHSNSVNIRTLLLRERKRCSGGVVLERARALSGPS